MIMYMIKQTEFSPPTYTLRSNPPHDGIPEELVAELDISTIEGTRQKSKQYYTTCKVPVHLPSAYASCSLLFH